MAQGTGRRSSRPMPTKLWTSMSCMKKDACAGSLRPRMSRMMGTGSAAICIRAAKTEPEMAETKKVWTTLKKVSLLKREAWTAVSATCPSIRANTARATGRRVLSTMRAMGATCASTWSSIGKSWEASRRKGSNVISESICVKVATKATGTVQSTHRIVVPNDAKTDDSCPTLWPIPTLPQHTSFGAGAAVACSAKGTTHSTVCLAMVAERMDRKDTKAALRTGLSSRLMLAAGGGSSELTAARVVSY
mmetsp:Transcript_19987/g.55462  ORF Transcript_19987/g.55462 Transcript_19987/m.55462 type:complete len:248 (+) Transcript_19987:832-1575(+)